MNAHIFFLFFSPCWQFNRFDARFFTFLPSFNHLLLSHVHSLFEVSLLKQGLRDVSHPGSILARPPRLVKSCGRAFTCLWRYENWIKKLWIKYFFLIWHYFMAYILSLHIYMFYNENQHHIMNTHTLYGFKSFLGKMIMRPLCLVESHTC